MIGWADLKFLYDSTSYGIYKERWRKMKEIVVVMRMKLYISTPIIYIFSISIRKILKFKNFYLYFCRFPTKYFPKFVWNVVTTLHNQMKFCITKRTRQRLHCATNICLKALLYTVQFFMQLVSQWWFVRRCSCKVRGVLHAATRLWICFDKS